MTLELAKEACTSLSEHLTGADKGLNHKDLKAYRSFIQVESKQSFFFSQST